VVERPTSVEYVAKIYLFCIYITYIMQVLHGWSLHTCTEHPDPSPQEWNVQRLEPSALLCNHYRTGVVDLLRIHFMRRRDSRQRWLYSFLFVIRNILYTWFFYSYQLTLCGKKKMYIIITFFCHRHKKYSSFIPFSLPCSPMLFRCKVVVKLNHCRD